MAYRYFSQLCYQPFRWRWHHTYLLNGLRRTWCHCKPTTYYLQWGRCPLLGLDSVALDLEVHKCCKLDWRWSGWSDFQEMWHWPGEGSCWSAALPKMCSDHSGDYWCWQSLLIQIKTHKHIHLFKVFHATWNWIWNNSNIKLKQQSLFLTEFTVSN